VNASDPCSNLLATLTGVAFDRQAGNAREGCLVLSPLVFFRFVELVRSKTPKVTLFTNKAKCMLMENDPDADLELCFYNGKTFTFFFCCINILPLCHHPIFGERRTTCLTFYFSAVICLALNSHFRSTPLKTYMSVRHAYEKNYETFLSIQSAIFSKTDDIFSDPSCNS